jgi:hypothetical protein
MLLLVLLVFVAPYVCQYDPARSWLLDLALDADRGRVTTQRASFGWFSPPAVHGLRVVDLQDQPVLTVACLQADRPLWRMLANWKEPGDFLLREPHLHLVLYEHDTNLRRVFGRASPRDASGPSGTTPQVVSRVRQMAAGLEIRDARIFVRRADSPRAWETGVVNLAARLTPERADSSQPGVGIRAGTLLERTVLTPELCDDMLKYAVPVLAGVTTAQGEVSIELDAWRIPLDQPETSTGGGRLKLHSVQVGAGPVVRQLAAQLGLHETVQLADESVVSFTLHEGRVFHEGLEFGLPGYRIRTSGSVGLDETLDLVAEIPVPLPKDLPEDRPLLRALSGQTLRIPIGGTFDQPRVQGQPLSGSILDLVGGTLDRLQGERGRDPVAPHDAPDSQSPASDNPLVDMLDLTGDLLRQLPLGEGQLRQLFDERAALPRRAPRQPEGEDQSGTRRPLMDRLRRERQTEMP